MDPAWKLAIAHEAVLSAATAALAARGYHTARKAHHYRVVNSLAVTVGLSQQRIDQLQKILSMRNAAS